MTKPFCRHVERIAVCGLLLFNPVILDITLAAIKISFVFHEQYRIKWL
jgi:hypothetical protein